MRLGSDGTTTSPVIAWFSDTDTGVIRSASDTFGIVAGGGERFRVSTTQLLANVDGSAGAPAVSWIVDPNTGMYRVAADVLGFATGGAEQFRIGTQLYANMDGSAAAPAWTWLIDTNTGMYRFGPDALGWAVGGAASMTLASTGFLGLGTTGPVGPLHVHRPAALDSFIQITNSTTGSTINDGMTVGTDGNASYVVAREGPFYIYTAGTWWFTFASNGQMRFHNGQILRPDNAGLGFQFGNGVNTSWGQLTCNNAASSQTNMTLDNGGILTLHQNKLVLPNVSPSLAGDVGMNTSTGRIRNWVAPGYLSAAAHQVAMTRDDFGFIEWMGTTGSGGNYGLVKTYDKTLQATGGDVVGDQTQDVNHANNAADRIWCPVPGGTRIKIWQVYHLWDTLTGVAGSLEFKLWRRTSGGTITNIGSLSRTYGTGNNVVTTNNLNSSDIVFSDGDAIMLSTRPSALAPATLPTGAAQFTSTLTLVPNV